MKRSPRYWIPLVAAVMAACSSDPTPPPKAEPELPVKPEPEPEPEPTCTTLEDKCKAESDTWVALSESSYSFQPPEGWIYAKMKDEAVTQSSDRGAVLVLSKIKPPKEELNKHLSERATKLAEVAGIDIL